MKLAHFAEPPTKGTNELLASNGIARPHAVDKIKADAIKLLDEIADKEEDCLKTIHTRYCIIKGLPISIADISRYQPSKKQMPHYYEYWYKFGTTSQFMLMTRDLSVTPEGLALKIEFAKSLIRDGE